MTQETFVELYLVKIGNISLEKAEKLVGDYCRRFPKKGIAGICGYIKYEQKHYINTQVIFNYIMYELEHAGLGNVKTSTESYWVEMENDKMPVL
jgi:hypothetical protein